MVLGNREAWKRLGLQVARGFVSMLAIHVGETGRRKIMAEYYDRKTGGRIGWKVGDFQVAKNIYIYG